MTARAFTLIEVLVVVTIILVLAGLTVAASHSFRGRNHEARTRVALGIIQQALATTQVGGRGQFAPIEHPFAGSAPPRRAFARWSNGEAVAATGTAFVGLTRLDAVPPAHRSQVLLADDVLSDPDLPHFIGVQRGVIGLLGAPRSVVTDHRRLVDPLGSAQIADPLTSGRRHRGASNAADQAQAIRLAIGETFAQELSQIGCLRMSQPTFTTAAFSGAVLTDGQTAPNWKPGLVRSGGSWIAYDLPGATLVDAWGREILVSTDAVGGRIRLLSAGRDGCFAWHPGENGTIDASIATIAASLHAHAWGTVGALGDDRRADSDNIGIQLEGDR